MNSWIFKNEYNVDCKVIRPFNIICKFAQNDNRVFCNFANRLINNQKMQVYLPATQTRTYCHYIDFFQGVIQVLASGNQFLYHVGNSDGEITIKGLAELFEKVSGKSDSIELIGTPSNYLHEPQRRVPSVDKITNELGYKPSVTLEEQVKWFWDWAKDNYKHD